MRLNPRRLAGPVNSQLIEDIAYTELELVENDADNYRLQIHLQPMAKANAEIRCHIQAIYDDVLKNWLLAYDALLDANSVRSEIGYLKD